MSSVNGLNPVAWEVRCCAADCDQDRHRPKSTPLRVEGVGRASAIRQIRAQGWDRAPGQSGNWWCPEHVAIAREADRQRAAKQQVGGERRG